MVAVTTTTTPTRRATRPVRHLSVVAPERFWVDSGTRGGPSSTRNPWLGVRAVSAATYRRRRLAALVVAVGLAFVAWIAIGALGGALTAPVRSAPVFPERATVVVVEPGDTLWSIARRFQPTGDLRPLVDRLAATNRGPVVHVGDRLVVS